MALLADYPPEQVDYWHDVGHADTSGPLLDKRAVYAILIVAGGGSNPPQTGIRYEQS